MTAQYANPVIRVSAPDPTAIRTADGSYYLYGTEDIRNLPIFRSDDLVHWTQVGTAFTDATRPEEVEGASLWAPEILKAFKIRPIGLLFHVLAGLKFMHFHASMNA